MKRDAVKRAEQRCRTTVGWFTGLLLLAVTLTVRAGGGSRSAASIPYESGPKPAMVHQAEEAFDRHPVLAGALRGVLAHYPYCRLASFDSTSRSENDLKSSQYNGGRLRITFIYFCFRHTKSEIEAALQLESAGKWQGREQGWSGEPDQADLVLTITGDFSPEKRTIFDPSINASACYSHFCGSN